MEEEEEEVGGWDKESDLQTTTLPPLIQLLLMALLAAPTTEPGDPEYWRLLFRSPEGVVVLQLTDGPVVVVAVVDAIADGATAGGMLDSSSEGS